MMAIIKTGDDMPVLKYYGTDGKEETCSRCHRPLVVLAVDNNDNKLVCECDDEGSDTQ